MVHYNVNTNGEVWPLGQKNIQIQIQLFINHILIKHSSFYDFWNYFTYLYYLTPFSKFSFSLKLTLFLIIPIITLIKAPQIEVFLNSLIWPLAVKLYDKSLKDSNIKTCYISMFLHSNIKIILNGKIRVENCMLTTIRITFLNLCAALAGVAQWTGNQPANWGVTSSIPSQGTSLGCGPGPHLGTCKKQPINVSLVHYFFPSLSSSLLLSLKVSK